MLTLISVCHCQYTNQLANKLPRIWAIIYLHKYISLEDLHFAFTDLAALVGGNPLKRT